MSRKRWGSGTLFYNHFSSLKEANITWVHIPLRDHTSQLHLVAVREKYDPCPTLEQPTSEKHTMGEVSKTTHPGLPHAVAEG